MLMLNNEFKCNKFKPVNKNNKSGTYKKSKSNIKSKPNNKSGSNINKKSDNSESNEDKSYVIANKSVKKSVLIDKPVFSIKVHLSFLLTAILAVITNFGVQYLFAFISISIHEAIHIYFGKLFNMKIYNIVVLPAGLTAVIDDANASLKEKIFMHLSGPLANIILFILTFSCSHIISSGMIEKVSSEIIGKKGIYILSLFYQINVYLAIFNLLPIFPLDGGRIFFEILAKQKGIYITMKYIKIISYTFFCLTFGVGIIQSYLHHNFNILIISIYLAYLMKSVKWEAVFMNLKQLLFRRSRILKKGVYPVRTIVALKNISLGDILKYMDFDNFHVIHILDDEFKLIHTLTEQDIIEGLIKYDNDITFEEFIKNKL
ncbi:MAG TPA: hypothetical protein GXX37_15865 [Clostridiaceae bacterium]|nr:hypothetical protein [Clostridiaceae bacterium]